MKGNEEEKEPKKERRPHRSREALHRSIVGIVIFVTMAIGLFFVSVVKDNLGLTEKPIALGATFSLEYAEGLGLNWKQAYIAVLDQLGVKRLRIPVYWDNVEKKPGVYDFSDVDWEIQQASQRGATVILAIGDKVPRWPECHPPDWAKGFTGQTLHDHVSELLQTTVNHFKNDPAVVMWQVENEPLFKFGLCPPPNDDFLKKEVATVRALDSRPIMITESGELSTWVHAAALADVLGISTYRTIWNKYIGYFYWPVTPKYYTARAQAISGFVNKVIVSELQAEPWGPGPIQSMSIAEQEKSMNPQRLADNISFVRKTGFPEAYLWGVEWWYWLKQKGHPEMWNAGIRAFHGQPIVGN